jgi:DeoR/GlpR family transcriptional regulator of sugar metabolism
MLVAGVDRALAHAAQEVVALVDHTKVGVDTMFQTVPTDDIAFLVTDAKASQSELSEFENAGVDVWVAPVPAGS